MRSAAAIIDIASDSVGGALIDSGITGSSNRVCPVIQTSFRQDILPAESLNLKRFLDTVVVALKDTALSLEQGGVAPREIRCFLSAPFYASQTRIIRFARLSPFKVTTRLLDKLVAADRKKFESDHPALYAEVPGDSHQILEDALMQVYLNRYATRAPINKIASELLMYHFLSIGSTRIIGRFKEVLEGVFGSRPVYFSSFPFTLFLLLRDILPISHNAVLLDLGGEVTEISLSADGVLVETASYPLGRNWLVRRVAMEFNAPIAEAYSMLKIYQSGKQHETISRRLKVILENAKEEWLKSFRSALSGILENYFISDQIITLGDQALTPFFTGWINETTFQDLTLTNRTFTTTLIQPETFNEWCGANWPLTMPTRDLHLIIESVLFNRLKNN